MEPKLLGSFTSKVVTSLYRQLHDPLLAEGSFSIVCPQLFAETLLKDSLLKKLVVENLDAKTARKNAVETFFVQEGINKETNRRLAKIYHGDPDRVLSRAQQIVSEILGPLNKAVISSIEHQAYFGPGSNVGTRGFEYTSLCDKVSARLTVTSDLSEFSKALVAGSQFLSRCYLSAEGPVSLIGQLDSVICDSKLAFVPKNATTDRSISVEPLLNSYFQNGVGSYLRGRFCGTGQDLRDQTRNQKAARYALDLGFCTVDLKNASNSLSIGLVKLMLARSHGWFQLLDLLRSKRYTWKKEVYEYQMFSGMGNGFTFPLESIIFYALTKSVHEAANIGQTSIHVYGDDIVCDYRIFQKLQETFDLLGLCVNEEKSFTSGLFYESCGAYFFKGQSVKPPFLRELLTDLSSAIRFHNRIWQWACRDEYTFDHRVIPVLRMIRKAFPFKFVHPELGDVGYFPCKSLGNGTLVKYVCWTPKSMKHRYRGMKGYWVCLKEALGRTVDDEPAEGLFMRRSKVVKYHRSELLYDSYRFSYIVV